MVIENCARAGGEIGAELAAKAPGDGYMLLFAAIGSLTIHAVAATHKPNELKTDLLRVSIMGREDLLADERFGSPTMRASTRTFCWSPSNRISHTPTRPHRCSDSAKLECPARP